MRAMGRAVVDMIAEHVSTLSAQPVGAKADPAEMMAKLREPVPESGMDFAPLLAQISRDVLANKLHVNHPRFFAYVPGPGNFAGAMADALASGFNVFAGTWLSASGPAAVEMVTIDWLRQLCGFDDSAGGLFVSGGSMANLTALAVARRVKLADRLDGAVVYCCDQAHSSLERALRLLGFLPHQIVKLPADVAFRMPMAELAKRVLADRALGLRPFCVVATAGTTNTGAIDPLPELAQLCREHDLWLHVDGAYGAAAVICERGKSLLGGLELADSLALDPHKWLFQPFECGCLLLRDARYLRETFQILPDYMRDAHDSGELNYADMGIQLSRGFRALKLWMSLKLFGLDAFRAAIARGFVLAELAEAEFRALDGWEIVSPAHLGIVCFAHKSGDDTFHLEMVQRMIVDGFALATSTALRGRTVLRMCTINPRTTEDDIRMTVRKLDELAEARVTPPAPPRAG